LLSSTYTIYTDGADHYLQNNINLKREAKKENLNDAIELAIHKIKVTGGTITLRGRKYKVSQPIRLQSNMNIQGEGKPPVIIISNDFNGGEAIFVADSANDVSVKNLSIIQNNTLKKISGIIFDYCRTSTISQVFMLGLTNNVVGIRNNSFLCQVTQFLYSGTIEETLKNFLNFSLCKTNQNNLLFNFFQ
jgi:hypothetical protein